MSLDTLGRVGIVAILGIGLLTTQVARAQYIESGDSGEHYALDLERDAQAEPLRPPRSFLPMLMLSYVVAPLLALPTFSLFEAGALAFFAVPSIVHAAYGDFMGGLIALFGYPGTMLSIGFAGMAIERQDCDEGEWFCGLGGFAVGALIGMVVWPILDVVLIAPRTWRVHHERERRVAFVPNILPGGAGLSLLARLP